VTEKKVPKLGVMMVGLGGNNGSTLTAGLIAHKKGTQWESKKGMHSPTFYGSFSQCATVRTGIKQTPDGKVEDVYVPIKDLLPQVNPVDFEITGWDISSSNMYDACKRA
jgi:myo-inositol-1-phosphate synthase